MLCANLEFENLKITFSLLHFFNCCLFESLRRRVCSTKNSEQPHTVGQPFRTGAARVLATQSLHGAFQVNANFAKRSNSAQSRCEAIRTRGSNATATAPRMPLELANILRSAKNHDHFESVCDTVCLPFVLCAFRVPTPSTWIRVWITILIAVLGTRSYFVRAN